MSVAYDSIPGPAQECQKLYPEFCHLTSPRKSFFQRSYEHWVHTPQKMRLLQLIIPLLAGVHFGLAQQPDLRSAITQLPQCAVST